MFVVGAIFLRPDIRDLRSIGVKGKLLWQRICDGGHSASRSTGVLFVIGLDRHAASQQSGQDTFNAEGHIACQRDRHAVHPLRNKCRGSAAQRPYVRLCPLAYVTSDSPRGSIGSPPEQGVGAPAVWSRHVPAPDPRLALIKAWAFFALGSRDPTVSSLDPS
jgi:hypothetical protein